MNEPEDGDYLFTEEDMLMIDKSLKDEVILHPEWVKNTDDFVRWVRSIVTNKE